ncbi:MAG: HAD-IA family hydrolase [Acidobacteria bacterium]|nr:HAD-IA family hydrolase [Acidobacteriota bacterium]
MKAVTFDFYNTLVYHRAGVGRGRQYQNYLSAVGFTSDPWEHQVLYAVFEHYGSSYSPALRDEAKLSFWTEFTRLLFERTGVHTSGVIDHTAHSPAIRDIMGPTCFAVFDEVPQVLRQLRAAGFRLGVISDWQKGLAHFCEELGIGTYLDVVVASGQAGFQKPDPRLFEIACERMKISPREILHVGDSDADIEGARAAGFSVALLVRSGESTAREVPIIRNLGEVFLCLKPPPT